MKKIFIILITLFFCINSATKAQYLVGFKGYNFIKRNMNSLTDSILFQNVNQPTYRQGNTTIDPENKKYYFIAVSNLADTLVELNLINSTISKYILPVNELMGIEYYNGAIYGVGPNGFMKYDLSNSVLQIIDSTFILPYFNSSMFGYKTSFDSVTKNYFVLTGNNGGLGSGSVDTFYQYNINTLSLIKDTVPKGYTIWEYSQQNNSINWVGSVFNNLSVKGVYKKGLNVNNVQLVQSIQHLAGTMTNTSSIDQLNNKLYFTLTAANFTDDTLYEVNLNTNFINKIPELVTNSISNYEFLDNFNITTSITNVIKEKNEEILIFPNPVNNSFSIKCLNGNAIEQIMIYTIDGKIINKFDHLNDKVIKISVSDLSNGLYLIHIKDKMGNINLRNFTKQ